jgi:hypothetical protein
MKTKMGRFTLWGSPIAGLIIGTIVSPIILPSGISGLHGMGASWDLFLAGLGTGVAFIAHALLSRYSHAKPPLSVATLK